MKKTIKKLTAVGLTLTSVMSLAACGGKTSDGGKSNAEVTKPDKFKVMVDNTILTEVNGGKDFYTYLEGLTSLDIEFVRPDHTSYYEAGVAPAFNNEDDMPDVVLLSSDYYALYAANGMLWNMTDAWNNSETKKSGRLISTADNVLNALMVTGEDGEKGMYGFSPFRGNGCCTYIKKSWLTDAGIDVSKVDGVQMDFNTYYGYLKTMADKKGHYVISSPGFVNYKEAPFTNYLPEFYQDANFTFYKDSTGKYIDGFSEDKMKKALARIAQGVADNVIDKESVNNGTANARDKFYSKDPASESGVFTYWAGTWAETLRSNLKSRGLDDQLVAIKPIKELGKYVERIAPAWCITTHAQNPEGIFKYFIDTMLDGGDIQTAWEYGAKGTHWDTKAESVTVKDKEDDVKTYTEGTFHMLPSPEDPTQLVKKNHIDPILALATFAKTDSNPDAKDPGDSAMTDTAKKNGEFFAANSAVATPLPMTEELGDSNNDINTARSYVISQVALGYMSVDDGMNYYNQTVGTQVKSVLDSLNKLK